jgi:hypothetical protein
MEKKKSVVKNNDALNEMLFRMKYNINESSRYHRIVDSGDEFDSIPEIYNTDDGKTPKLANEVAGEQEDALPIGSKTPTDTDPSTENPNLAVPPAGANVGGLPGAEVPPTPPVDPMNAPPTDVPQDPMAMGGMPAPAPPSVDVIQNDIIKHNTAAMQAIHDQMEALNGFVQSLDSKMKLLDADIEEVREPTNVEKLMNKTSVSYPYYFNLNDLWGDNLFDKNRASEGEVEVERGIRELPDGTFIADFDDLPKSSKIDIEKSFNDIV